MQAGSAHKPKKNAINRILFWFGYFWMQSQISCHFTLYSKGIDRASIRFANVNALPNHLCPHGESLVCLSQYPVLFCHTAFFPADRDRCRDTSQSQEHNGKGTLHTIVVPGLRADGPTGKISTQAFLNPQIVHSSCWLPLSVAVASLSITHLNSWAATFCFLPQSEQTFQWLSLSDIQSELLLCASAHFA